MKRKVFFTVYLFFAFVGFAFTQKAKSENLPVSQQNSDLS